MSFTRSRLCTTQWLADILGDHGFAQPIATDEHKIASFGEEVQGERALNDIPFDLGRPRPFVVRHGFKTPDPGYPQALLQAAASTLLGFRLCHLLQEHVRGPAGFGGACHKIVQVSGQRPQTDVLQLVGKIIYRSRRRHGGGG
jgi:hypothetical protein